MLRRYRATPAAWRNDFLPISPLFSQFCAGGQVWQSEALDPDFGRTNCERLSFFLFSLMFPSIYICVRREQEKMRKESRLPVNSHSITLPHISSETKKIVWQANAGSCLCAAISWHPHKELAVVTTISFFFLLRTDHWSLLGSSALALGPENEK